MTEGAPVAASHTAAIGPIERVHVLLPVHNRCATTVAFVTSLRAQTWSGTELVLIDDGSTDGTAEAVTRLWPSAHVLRGSGSWWWAGALDQGIRHLEKIGARTGDAVLLINDDVVIGPSFLQDGVDELSACPGTLLLARQHDADTGREIDHGGGVHADLRRLRFAAAATPDAVNCLPTRGLFVRWGDLLRVGGFRPDKLPHYLSDYEFTLRAARRGLSLRVARRASLGVRMRETGRAIENLFSDGRLRRLGLLFSRRFKDNPVTWTAFVNLAVPWSRRPVLWAKIWIHFLYTAARCVVLPRQRVESR